MELCSKSTFTIVSHRLKSDTKPAENLNSLHESGICNTEAPLFDDEHIRKFVETFDAQNRGDGKKGGIFMSRDGCRQSYVMTVKYKSPKEAAQQAHEVMKASLILLANEGNMAARHLLELWEVSEHIRVIIDHGGNKAADRFDHPEATTEEKNKKRMNLAMHRDFGFENLTWHLRFVTCHWLLKKTSIDKPLEHLEGESHELQQIGLL